MPGSWLLESFVDKSTFETEDGRFLSSCHFCGKVEESLSPKTRWFICHECRHTPLLKEAKLYVVRYHYRAIKKGVESTMSPLQWLRCREFFEYKCSYCDDDYYCAEHFVPMCVGGGFVVDNIVLSCNMCNSVKRHHSGCPSWTLPECRAKVEEYFALPDLHNPPLRNPKTDLPTVNNM